MRRWMVLLLLLVAGCDSDFYRQDTQTWFGFPPTPPADKKSQTPAVGKTDAPQQ